MNSTTTVDALKNRPAKEATMTDQPELSSQELLQWFQCHKFLATEAEYLDDDRMDDWLGLLAPDIEYEIPVRVTRRRGEDPIVPNSWHMKESFGSLRNRVERLATGAAWGEDPPSRVRRYVTNLRCSPLASGATEAKSNILAFRSRGDSPEHVLFAGERRDVLRMTDQGLRLARRVVILSHTTLPAQNLGIFL